MDITKLTVHELKQKLDNKEITIPEVVGAYINRINEKEKDVQAFITTSENEALEKAKEIQEK